MIGDSRTSRSTLKAFYKPAYSLNEFGHGGEKRSRQIHDLCKHVMELVNVNELESRFYSIRQRLWAGLTFLFNNKLPLRSIAHVSLTGHHVLNLICWIYEHPEISVFVWEPSSNYSDFYIPLVCNSKGIRVIALPHNIESLVSKRKSEASGVLAPDWFKEELHLLKCCDSVLTISMEEQWLLGLYGVKAKCLQYFPSRSVIEQFDRIRSLRVDKRPAGPLLMLGTALNPPTREGMKAVIDYFIMNEISSDLIIAGFGTENLAQDYSELPINIILQGTVDSEELDNLLIACKAVLIHQVGGTGALTKVKELLIGGVPVIANSTALRSYQNIKGFYPFDTFDFFKRLAALHLDAPERSQLSDNDIREEQRCLMKQVLSC